MQPIEKYIYVSEKAPIYMLTRNKTPKRSKFRVTNLRKKTSEPFLWHGKSVIFSSRNKFINLGPFAKVSVLVETTIPCTFTSVLALKVSTMFTEVVLLFIPHNSQVLLRERRLLTQYLLSKIGWLQLKLTKKVVCILSKDFSQSKAGFSIPMHIPARTSRRDNSALV